MPKLPVKQVSESSTESDDLSGSEQSSGSAEGADGAVRGDADPSGAAGEGTATGQAFPTLYQGSDRGNFLMIENLDGAKRTVSLYLCSSGTNITRYWGPWAPHQLKIQDRDRFNCWK